MNYAIEQAGQQGGRMMNDKTQPQKMTIKQQPQQDQVMVSAALLQQMQAQMTNLQEQLQAQQEAAARMRQPVVKTYTFSQIQILLACETINSVIEEYELSIQKKARLCMARDYLLSMGDLPEFLKLPEPVDNPNKGQTHVQEDEGVEIQQEPGIDNLFETDAVDDSGVAIEEYQGQADQSVKEGINKINKQMAEFKKEEVKVEKEKSLSGIEKIKNFISKKNNPEPDQKKSYEQYEGVPEGMG
jgi:hypothetical protein